MTETIYSELGAAKMISRVVKEKFLSKLSTSAA